MEKGVERLEYDVAFSPPGDGDCFYASAARNLVFSWEKNLAESECAPNVPLNSERFRT